MDSIFNAIRKTGFRRGPNAMLGGVCAGIARSLGIEANLVRLIVVALMIFAGLPLAVYVIVWLLTPAQDESIPLQTFLASLGVGSNGKAKTEYPTTPATAVPPVTPTYPTASTDGVEHVYRAEDR
ncbi:PspC domain-containing protein [Salana multivorans]